MVNDALLEKKGEVKQVSRINWFKMQEERKKKEEELMRKQTELKKMQ